jgi:transcription antitermination factor NusG
MEWVVVQLTSWADKKVLTLELAKKVRQALDAPDLEIYYPVFEDVVGKHVSPYSEYLFIEYRQEVPYSNLDGGDLFKSVVRQKGKIQVLPNSEIERIRESLESSFELKPGDRVRVTRGPYTGSPATVLSSDEKHVQLNVYLGESPQQAVIPRKWLRRVQKASTT